jgi:large subunit ribosomal protein L25
LPTDIPQNITIDVSPLLIGEQINVSDLPKLEGVEYLQEPETLIVHIVSVTAEETAESAEGAAAEPEVISKGKKDKEGEGESGAAPQGDKK